MPGKVPKRQWSLRKNVAQAAVPMSHGRFREGRTWEPRAAAGGGKPGCCDHCDLGESAPEERGGGQRTPSSSEERRPFQFSEQEQDSKPCKDGEAPVRGLLQAVL